eukprot:3529527-Prymnesium_polylepis.1
MPPHGEVARRHEHQKRPQAAAVDEHQPATGDSDACRGASKGGRKESEPRKRERAAKTGLLLRGECRCCSFAAATAASGPGELTVGVRGGPTPVGLVERERRDHARRVALHLEVLR